MSVSPTRVARLATVLLVVLAGTVAFALVPSTNAAASSRSTTAPTGPAVQPAIGESLNNTTDTGDGGSDSTPGTTDSTADPTDTATDSTGSLTDSETATSVEDSTDSVSDSIDSVDGTTDHTTESTDSVRNSTATIDTVRSSTDLVDITRTLQNATDSVTDGTTSLASAPPNSTVLIEELAVGRTDSETDTRTRRDVNETVVGSGSGGSGSAGGGSRDVAEGIGMGSSWTGAGIPTSGAGSSPIATGVVGIGAVVIATAAGRQLSLLTSTWPATSKGVLGSGQRGVLRSHLEPLREWFRGLPGLVGYQRYDDSDPLEHDTRERLYEFLQETPGAYLSEIETATDYPLSTIRYHLRILEHENLVSQETMRGKSRYFPAGIEPSVLQSALESDGAAAVLEALARDGPGSVSAVAEAVDRDVSTVSYHLESLEAEGLVEREQDGPAVRNRLAHGVAEVMDQTLQTPVVSTSGETPRTRTG